MADLAESLLKIQTITDNMVSILGSFDHRLSALETAMRLTQIRTHSIRRAHENIDKTLKAADVILAQFDLTRQAEAKILRGPHEDLKSYLQAVDQLKTNIRFFRSNKSFKSSDDVLNNANTLLAKAISKLEEEFRQLLSSYSNSSWRLNYFVGGEITMFHLDRPMYLLGYLANQSRVYLIDKEFNVMGYSLLLGLIEYKTLVIRGDVERANELLPSIPKEHHNRWICLPSIEDAILWNLEAVEGVRHKAYHRQMSELHSCLFSLECLA